jgi:hypothetical protein
MPRKALAPARAALRFAQEAADEGGPVQRADAGLFEPWGSARIKGIGTDL